LTNGQGVNRGIVLTRPLGLAARIFGMRVTGASVRGYVSMHVEREIDRIAGARPGRSPRVLRLGRASVGMAAARVNGTK